MIIANEPTCSWAGVIPRQDYVFLFLYEAGVKGNGPGTPIPASAKDVLEQIRAASLANAADLIRSP